MSKYSNSSLLQPGEKVSDEQLVTEMNLLRNQRAINRLSRRRFLQSAGIAAGALGTAGVFGCGNDNSGTTTTTTTSNTTTPSVTDVLNFALNLEYLEATFYSYIATGAGLPSSLTGSNPGSVSGGTTAFAFTDPNVSALAQQLYADEQAHVGFIQSAITSLGATPVSLPQLNLIAMGPVTTDAQFLALARQLEAVGVSAYEGAITYLVSNTSILTAAAIIHDTEGQHESALRQFCIAKGVTSAAVDSQDTPPTITTVFNTSPTTGLNPERTVSEVLQIVYAAPGQTGVGSGGFFPAGMNGALITS